MRISKKSSVVLILATCVWGCFSSRDVPALDGGDTLRDAGRPDARADAHSADAGLDAFAPFPDRDAGPLPAARETMLLLTWERSSASGRLLRLEEIDRSMRRISSTIVPGTDLFDGSPADMGRIVAARIEVSRDGRVHVIETTERSGPIRSTTIHSLDLDTGEWRALVVPPDLGSTAVPDGDAAISVVERRPEEWYLVRWDEGGVLLERPLAGVSASFVGLFPGGDGFVYARESVGGVQRLHALDPVALTNVRDLDIPFDAYGVRIDSDGSAVFVDRHVTRWTPVGATTRSSVELPSDARLQAISRSGEILVANTDGWVAIFDRDLALSVEQNLPTELWTPRMAWAWTDPAAR